VSRDDSVLNVDLSSEFGSGGGSLSMQLRVAQVVYTGTQFDGVDSVQILIDGERVDALGGEGIAIGEPLTRRDFQDFAPAIVVETPKPGETISSGALVTGFANVFEANVNIRVTGANDKVLVETFTTATCGTGCWGDFSKALKFSVDHEQQGRVEVLTFSAEDGSQQDLVSIPVTLTP
jgi:immunoglobulin-like protein involved in spore germination/sporulation and spore germination protein